MNLEQRLAAVETELTKMKSQQEMSDGMSQLMQKVAIEAIKKSLLPGGFLYQHGNCEKAAALKRQPSDALDSSSCGRMSATYTMILNLGDADS
ncbi:hypothetical protein P0E69_09705 [Chimaeribacter arupi]|uniref:Uncharacterized protein n=1 Tax=Nissabacter archeti TaxID=1917880 RepID=A0ABS5JCL5_9GAMM|nr:MULTISPECIES: hypothetical protein [Yersiniaceae]MBS0967680.1 hypothetical protein [Nissabacter archeti]WKZ94117.1 hypothetical protein P0E69_09705 [Chimaeribacter arupi]